MIVPALHFMPAVQRHADAAQRLRILVGHTFGFQVRGSSDTVLVHG